MNLAKGIVFNIRVAKGILSLEIGLANGTTLNVLAADPYL